MTKMAAMFIYGKNLKKSSSSEPIMYYLETIAATGLKVGLNIQIYKLMKFNEYQRSMSLFDLG